MTTLIAYGNIHTPFPFEHMPSAFVPERLQISLDDHSRVVQRHQCRRLAHFLLWQLLKTVKKSTALLTQIDYTESGRPYFRPDKAIDFNISHSGDWVAVMVDVNEERKSAVGIDIEFPKARNFKALIEHIVPRPQGRQELDWFNQQSQSSQAEAAFYRCWCLREAVLKSQGAGIVGLSRVTHFPQEQQIFSRYCPLGTLFFTDELPFYCAAFVNRTQASPQFFCWNGETLQPQPIKNALLYQVNERRQLLPSPLWGLKIPTIF